MDDDVGDDALSVILIDNQRFVMLTGGRTGTDPDSPGGGRPGPHTGPATASASGKSSQVK